MLAVSSQDSKVRVWNASSGVSVAVLDGGPMESWSLCWNPDTSLNQLLTAGHSGEQNVFFASLLDLVQHSPKVKSVCGIWIPKPN
jgi:WD40 repeat protein